MTAVDRVGSEFARAVLARMKELGLNHSSLARRMKCARPYVVKVLHGDVSVTLRSAFRFAKALEMDFLPLLVPKKAAVAGKGSDPMPEGKVTGKGSDPMPEGSGVTYKGSAPLYVGETY